MRHMSYPLCQSHGFWPFFPNRSGAVFWNTECAAAMRSRKRFGAGYATISIFNRQANRFLSDRVKCDIDLCRRCLADPGTIVTLTPPGPIQSTLKEILSPTGSEPDRQYLEGPKSGPAPCPTRRAQPLTQKYMQDRRQARSAGWVVARTIGMPADFCQAAHEKGLWPVSFTL